MAYAHWTELPETPTGETYNELLDRVFGGEATLEDVKFLANTGGQEMLRALKIVGRVRNRPQLVRLVRKYGHWEAWYWATGC
ncbi:hypothetical protein ACPC54_19465 [Kitasatospora sp. NPDC094028]